MNSSKRRIRGSCLVCTSNAVGVNFGVPTCAPCKAFFRRNAVRLGSYEFVCPKDGDCPIIHTYRRLCNCCRLAKCFRVGMKKDLILSDAQKEERKNIIEQNRQRRAQEVQTKSLALIRPSNLLLTTHDPTKCLSGVDQTVLANIFSAYERTCVATRNSTHQYFPSKVHSSIHSVFNEYGERQISLIEYFKLVPEFNQLSISDKKRLVQNNFGIMVTLNEAPNLPKDYDVLPITFNAIYGIELAQHLFRAIELMQNYRFDPILIKILLIVQNLSSGSNRYNDPIDMDRIYADTKAIMVAHDIYAELLWKYILSRSPSEREAIKFFNRLIADLLIVVDVSYLIETFLYCFGGEIEKMEPLLGSILLAPRKK